MSKVNAYILTYDSITYLVIAESMPTAIAAWKWHVRNEDLEDDEPESCSLLDVEEIIQSNDAARAAGS